MSLHKSLKSRNKLKRRRSVLKRPERVALLERDGRRGPEDSVFGLPKVRVEGGIKKAKGKAKKKAEGEEAAAAAGGAAPAAESK